MERKRRGFVVLVAVAALMLVLFAPCTNAKSRKGHKVNLDVCNPFCFARCAADGSDIYCYAKCLLECIEIGHGKPDPTNPREICLASCVVPACAKLCTKQHPFPRTEVQTCLQTCSANCDEIETDKMQLHH
ncbi:hypothetical protein LINGRAPRIM_LOCUS2152 [Linum grandiflorum]